MHNRDPHWCVRKCALQRYVLCPCHTLAVDVGLCDGERDALVHGPRPHHYVCLVLGVSRATETVCGG